MSPFRLARVSLILAAISLNLAPALTTLGASAHAATPATDAPATPAAAETLRPAMGKLLDFSAIKQSITAKNYLEVQRRIDQSEAMPDKTAYESFILNRVRVALGAVNGDSAMSMKALKAVIDSKRLAPTEQGDFIQTLANYYYNAKDYPQAIVWFTRYQEETGDHAKVRPYMIRAYYFSNDFAKTKQELLLDLQASDKAGAAPTLEALQLLANASAKTKDTATFIIAMEKLVQFYPSDDYWSDLLNHTQNKAGYSNRFQLDLYRLERMAVRAMTPEEYTEMAELALLAGFPAEAKKSMDTGYTAGVLGNGQHAAKQNKVREQANKAAADDQKNIAASEVAANKTKDGIALINLGYAYVTMEQYDKGLDLIQKGIAKGSLKRPEDAKLRLGYAYAMAGRKDDAIKTLLTVQGSDGASDLARYWILWLNRPAPIPKA